MADIENIELRSEKTRQIICMPPSRFVRYGTQIMFFIIAAVLAIACFVPYPENLQAEASVGIDTNGETMVYAYIPYSQISTIHEGMNAEIEFEGYLSDYGHVSAVISRIDKDVNHVNGQSCIKVEFNTQFNTDIAVSEGMSGKVSLLISDRSIIKKMLNVR
jgi:hypothetical protein